MNPSAYFPRDFLWSQRDLRWSWKRLGGSPLTVGNFGCAATCVNYVINRAWQTMKIDRLSRPGNLVDFGNRWGKFSSGGLIHWNIADKYTDGMVVNTWDKDEAHYTLQEVKWGTLRHWIVLLRSGLAYDPWKGTVIQARQPYWTPTGRFQYYRRAR